MAAPTTLTDRFFKMKKGFFLLYSAGVAGEFSVSTHEPMTGDQDGNGIPAYSIAHCLGRFAAQLLGKITVSAGFSIGNLQKQFPHL